MQPTNPFPTRPPDQNQSNVDIPLSSSILQVEEEFVRFDISKLATIPPSVLALTRRHTLPSHLPFSSKRVLLSTLDQGDIADDEYHSNTDDDVDTEEDEDQQNPYINISTNKSLIPNDQLRPRRRRRRKQKNIPLPSKSAAIPIHPQHAHLATTPSPTSVSFTSTPRNEKSILTSPASSTDNTQQQQQPSTQLVLSPGTLRRIKPLSKDQWEKSRKFTFPTNNELSTVSSPPTAPPRRTHSATAALQTYTTSRHRPPP